MRCLDAYGNETGAGAANCQNATGGPGSGTLAGTEEAPNGDDDNDDLPDLNDPQCRVAAPGDTLSGQTGEDYIEGNQGSDNAAGNEGEDDVIGGSSANTGHLNVILPPADRDSGFAPGAITDAGVPFNLLDGHDVIEGNDEDDTVLGDNAFVDRYLTPSTGAWITIVGAGHAGAGELDVPNPEPAKAPFEASDLVRRDVTTKSAKEDAGAFGNDYVRGGAGQDDVYGTLGNDWLEGNENEDAIVGDMGKVVDNVLGADDAGRPARSAAAVHRPEPAVPRRDHQPDRRAQARGDALRVRPVARRPPASATTWRSAATATTGSTPARARTWRTATPATTASSWATTSLRRPPRRPAQSLLAHDRVDAGWGGLGLRPRLGRLRRRLQRRPAAQGGEVPGPLPGERSGDVVPGCRCRSDGGLPPPAPQEFSQNG